MKKLFILGLMAVSGFFVSCEEEEVADFVNRDYLQGTWVVTQTGELRQFNNGSAVVTVVDYTDVVNDPACNADNFMLNADGTFALNDYENVGGVCENDAITGAYTRSDNRIYLTFNDGTGTEQLVVMNISTLTYNELLVSYAEPGTTKPVFVRFARPEAAN